MALPVTITGISPDIAVVGPYQSSAGNFYFFGKDGTTDTILQCYKATDPTVSWSSVATKTGFDTNIWDVTGCQDGDVIHLAVMDGDAAFLHNYIKYRTFNMATDSFVVSETIISDFKGQTYIPGVAIIVRSGDNPVVAYNGKDTNLYTRIYYSRRTGTNSWSAKAQVDANDSKNYTGPVTILGNSDEVHFLFNSGTALYQRALDSANHLKTITTTTGTGSSAMPIEGISFDVSGTTKCIVVTRGESLTYFDAGDTPTLTAIDLGVINTQSERIFSENGIAYLLYSQTSGSNRDYYFKSSTDGGATWSAATFICHSTNDAAIRNTSRFSKLYPTVDDIILPFVYADAGTIKHNHKVVATTAVDISLSSAISAAACASVAKTFDKSIIAASTNANISSIAAPSVIVTANKVATSAALSSIVADGGDVSVNLQSVAFGLSAGAFGTSSESEGAAIRVSLTRLGPGGYPVATIAGAAAGPTTDVTLFSVASAGATGSVAECQFAFGAPVAISSAAVGLSVWTSAKSLSYVSTQATAANLGRRIESGVLPSGVSGGVAGSINPTNYIWLVDISAAGFGRYDSFIAENLSLLEGVASTAAVGDFAPYAFTGTSIALNSVASQAIAENATPLNEAILQGVSAYATNNIILMEGDEAFNLAAAAAAGTVGDLLVAIVIPPAIKWLVCASIDIVPEVAGDLAMNAEMQATVIAAAALQGSPQIGPEVDGTLEIAPFVSGSPSMKEC